MELPPDLIYLVIYNTTLKPVDNSTTDDEDAEEQSQILFYTAKERAVSKDKMLRQVGLAKALINFSSISDTHHICESVHSQGRRMLMLSPEPNFWIHVCIELAKTPRPPPAKQDKGKGKAKASGGHAEVERVIYDYHENSLHDTALKTHLRVAYEYFKIAHGPFSNILNTLGRTALELQLERFFTVWAWAWDFDSCSNLASNLGPPIHPHGTHLLPHISSFSSSLPQGFLPILLDPPYIIASKHTLSNATPYSPFLPSYLLSRFPVARKPESTSSEKSNRISTTNNSRTIPHAKKSSIESLSGINTLNNMSSPVYPKIDVRKWDWQGVLTFGLAGKTNSPFSKEKATASPVTIGAPAIQKTESNKSDNAVEMKEEAHGPHSHDATQQAVAEGGPHSAEGVSIDMKSSSIGQELELAPKVEIDLDESALAEALASQGTLSPIEERSRLASAVHSDTSGAVDASNTEDNKADHDASFEESRTVSAVDRDISAQITEISPANTDSKLNATELSILNASVVRAAEHEKPAPTFSHLHIHNEQPGNMVEARKEKILYMKRGNLVCALIPTAPYSATTAFSTSGGEYGQPNHIDLNALARSTSNLLNTIQQSLDNVQEKSDNDRSHSHAVSSLLQKSQYVISTAPTLAPELSFSPSVFSSTSEHLHSQRGMLLKHEEVAEIFSRGQNPQDWYITKRLLSFKSAASPLVSSDFDRPGDVGDGEDLIQGINDTGKDTDNASETNILAEPSIVDPKATLDESKGNRYTVYMEIGRKEASLTDVDSEIISITRSFMESNL